MQSSSQAAYRRNLRLILLESAITASTLSKSIMSPFLRSIGMSQADIATSQAIFTIVTIFLNFPTGWLADRLSRKWANVVGDIGHAIVLLGYATVNSFYGVVCCQILSGIFRSLSKGVDKSLLRHSANQIDPSEKLFWAENSRLALLRQIFTSALTLLGGPIGAIDFRLAIAIASIPYWLGGLAALFIYDDSARLVTHQKNPLHDMWAVIRDSLRNEPLRLRIATYAVGREMTRTVTWIFTPMLLYVGVPLSIVSCGWVLKSLAAIIGMKIAGHFAAKLRDWQIFAVPFALTLISMGTLSLSLNIVTIWLYLLMGVAQGWSSATLAPMMQKRTKPEEQTSILSFAHTLSKLVHAPLIWVVGWAADFDLRYATLATFIVIGALGSMILARILRE